MLFHILSLEKVLLPKYKLFIFISFYLFLLQKVKLGLDKSAQLVEEREFRNEFLVLLNDLSDREMTVLRHVVAGLHNKEIAELLGNSSRTVEIHRANMFEKMGVKSAIELARLMERHGSDK